MNLTGLFFRVSGELTTLDDPFETTWRRKVWKNRAYSS